MSIRIVRGEDIHHERSHLTADATALLAVEPLILDTETTGLGDEAEICEIAVIRHDGSVVLDTLVRPTGKISAGATRVHGITDADVRDAPSIDDVLDASVRLLLASHQIAIYNADYDLRLLRQSAAAAGQYDINIWAMGMRREAFCVMEAFAEWYGSWNVRHESYTWQKLETAALHFGLSWDGKAHRALTDARMTLEVVKSMAKGN